MTGSNSPVSSDLKREVALRKSAVVSLCRSDLRSLAFVPMKLSNLLSMLVRITSLQRIDGREPNLSPNFLSSIEEGWLKVILTASSMARRKTLFLD